MKACAASVRHRPDPHRRCGLRDRRVHRPRPSRAPSCARPASGERGVVATESPAAARVGRSVLERGGNAVDAAAATVFALNVARPAVVRHRRRRVHGLPLGQAARPRRWTSARPRPARFTPDTLTPDGPAQGLHRPPDRRRARHGGRACRRRCAATATRSLAQSILPAERLAARRLRGAPVAVRGHGGQRRAARSSSPPRRGSSCAAASPTRPGSILRQPDLAHTLRTIRSEGPRAFYDGSIARKIDAEMDRTRAKPIPGDAALLTAGDLRRYQAKWRAAAGGHLPRPQARGHAPAHLRRHRGAGDAQHPRDASTTRRRGQSSADTLHRIIEAQKLAFADRGEYVADPDFVRQPTRHADLQAATPPAAPRRSTRPRPTPSPSPAWARAPRRPTARRTRPGTTTHLSVIDAWGNSVALTCTHRAGVRLGGRRARHRLPAQQRDDRLRRSRLGQRGARVQAAAVVDGADHRQRGRPPDRRDRRRRRLADHHGLAVHGVQPDRVRAAAEPGRRRRARGRQRVPGQAASRSRTRGWRPACSSSLRARGHTLDLLGEYDITPARAGRRLPLARRAGPRTPSRTRAPTTARWPSGARRRLEPRFEYQTTSMPRASQWRAPA